MKSAASPARGAGERDPWPTGGSSPSSSGDIPSPPPGHDAPLVLGTAGHIDHGKTALVTLLTGKNTDRLKEERERGISIELGYAELQLPTGRRLSVVDVPGHERFVRAMVAGATGVDLFLLVVAADDGVMPQTVEHLAILDLLGVPLGVVALTKADLVDDELLEMVHEDVEAFLAETRYAGAPVVAVSARDGRGIPQLIGALEEACSRAARRRSEGPARLAVDRVFSLKGIGTVATGTLWRGRIVAGDVMRIEPGEVSATVRSVEVHDRAAQAGLAGQRVGVNLRVGEKAALARGRWLVAPCERAAVTTHFDAWLRLLPGARRLRSGEPLRVHHGTAQHVARVVLVEGKDLAAGSSGAVSVRLEDEVYVEPHDRFIVRTLSPAATVGGGVVLDAVPVHWHDRAEHAAFLAALHEGNAAAAIAHLATARGAGGLAAADFVHTTIEPPVAERELRAATARGELDELAAPSPVGTSATVRWFLTGTLEQTRVALATALQRHAAERPDKPALTLTELAAAVPRLRAAEVEALVGQLVKSGTAVVVEGGFALAGAGGVLAAAHEESAARLLHAIAGARFSPPTLALLAEDIGLPRRDVLTILAVLVRRGQLVRVKEDLWFSTEAVAEARERLLAALAHTPQITLAGYRDLLQTGRKNAQALLEHFDGEGLTRRVGEARVLRGRR
jgi:selenocysteine-specific elongation factor